MARLMPTIALIGILLASANASAKGPGLPDISGWKGAALEEFDRQTIFRAINGAADVFLRFGFEYLRMRRYTQAELEIEVSVYDMGKPLNAFGVFAVERPAKATVLPVDATGLAAPPWQCLLRKDRFYVKVGALKGKLDVPSCETLIKALAASLPGSNEEPAALSRLPKANRIESTVGYTREGYLGLSDLKDCVHAEYANKAGDKYQAFVLLAAEQAADKAWKALGPKWKTVPSEPSAKARKIPYRGLAVLMRTAKGIVGVVEAGDEKTSITRIKALVTACEP